MIGGYDEKCRGGVFEWVGVGFVVFGWKLSFFWNISQSLSSREMKLSLKFGLHNFGLFEKKFVEFGGAVYEKMEIENKPKGCANCRALLEMAGAKSFWT